MDNGQGGQNNADWNKFRQQAGMSAGGNSDGQKVSASTEPTSAEKQQRTATELARKKVLEIYKQTGREYKEADEKVSAPKVNAEDWKKYHSAWQDYYKKYYGEYYGKAARDYVARERLKMERKRAETGVGDGENLATTSVEIEQKNYSEDEKQTQDEFRQMIRDKVSKRAKKMRKSRHFIPISIGVAILLFGVFMQYNQVIVGNVMAYMSPGGSDVNEISVLDSTIAQAVHEEPTLIIPKINVEVPVKFGSGNSVLEMSEAMDNGVAHYSIPGASALPGQIGNYVVTGHSAGNIYQQSDYKFIFSGLTRLSENDLMYMDYEGVRYSYKITGTRVVEPTEVSSLREIAEENSGKPMMTLITCTPLGTSRYRLLVYGEQIYPSYDNATTSAMYVGDDEEEIEMPANDPSPLESFWNWLTGQS